MIRNERTLIIFTPFEGEMQGALRLTLAMHMIENDALEKTAVEVEDLVKKIFDDVT